MGRISSCSRFSQDELYLGGRIQMDIPVDSRTIRHIRRSVCGFPGGGAEMGCGACHAVRVVAPQDTNRCGHQQLYPLCGTLWLCES